MAVNNERDIKQRSFGCTSFSVLVHASMLALVVLLPQSRLQIDTAQAGSEKGSTVTMDLASPSAPADASAQNPAAGSAPPSSPALLAQDNDPTGVAVAPPPAAPSALPAKLPEKIETPTEQPKPKPQPVVQKTPAKKFVTQLPKKAPSHTNTMTATDSDVAVKAALNDARQEEPQEETDTTSTNSELKPIVEKTEAQPETPSEAQPPVPADDPAPKAEPVAAPQPKPEQKAKSADLPAAIAEPVTPADAATKSADGSAAEGSTGATERKGNPLGIPNGAEIRNAAELAELDGNRPPEYPAQDRLKNREGTTVLVGKVLADGNIAQATLQKSSGSKAMDRASLEAFKKWRFKPGQEGYVYKTFRFSLKGEAQEVPSRLGNS